MSVTIVPAPQYEICRARAVNVGDWIGESREGPWHYVLEAGDTCLLVGDRRADARVVEVADPDGPVYRLDPAEAPRRY